MTEEKRGGEGGREERRGEREEETTIRRRKEKSGLKFEVLKRGIKDGLRGCCDSVLSQEDLEVNENSRNGWSPLSPLLYTASVY